MITCIEWHYETDTAFHIALEMSSITSVNMSHVRNANKIGQKSWLAVQFDKNNAQLK